MSDVGPPLSVHQEWFQFVFTFTDLILLALAFLIVLVLFSLKAIHREMTRSNELSNQMLVELIQLNSDVADLAENENKESTDPVLDDHS